MKLDTIAAQVAIVGAAITIGVVLAEVYSKAVTPDPVPTKYNIYVGGSQPFTAEVREISTDGPCTIYQGAQAVRVCAPHVAIEVLPGAKPVQAPPAPPPASK